KAACRFLDNDKVTFAKVLEPRVARTKEQMAGQQVVLPVQDTTEADLTRPEQGVEGGGELDDARRGILVHEMEAFTPEGTPLGRSGPKCSIARRACHRHGRRGPAACPGHLLSIEVHPGQRIGHHAAIDADLSGANPYPRLGTRPNAKLRQGPVQLDALARWLPTFRHDLTLRRALLGTKGILR